MLWFVGKVSKEMRHYCSSHAVPYGVFTARPDLADGKRIVYVNMRNRRTTEASLRSLVHPSQVDGVVVSGYEHYVLPAAWIAQYFGVPGPSPKAALAATDKAIMRRAFRAFEPAITPDFALVKSWDDIKHFADSHRMPLMLKPANLMKSLFITKNETIDQLQTNYQTMRAALPAAYRRYNLGKPRVVIEEYLAGSMHTVAGFVDAGGRLTTLDAVVDCITAQEIGKRDNYLFARRLPSVLPSSDQALLVETARQGVAALGLTSCPIHAELMLTADGPKLIEIGARLGGYRGRMYDFARGVNLFAALFATARNEPPLLDADRLQSCTVLELFADTESTFIAVANEAALRALPSFRYLHCTVHPGEPTGRARAGFRAPLIVMLGHKDAAQVATDTEWVREHVTIRVRAA
jgi:hypothetical protein